ncbi:MAG: transcription termination/antitermination protein NusA [Saccharospirillaceae bacterium]|nr:transcription termination factor NusA [Pseudomonadales bacterium]NRB77965.1 transcription termination/antitermination protein NusA [Saccharospirillaceae bacterium]
MSKEILLVIDAVANEKGVEKEVIFEAMELALAAAAKKRFDHDEEGEADVRVTIDDKTGEYVTFRYWLVRADDEMAALGTELTLEEAAEYDTTLKAGDIYSTKIDNAAFGRIAAQAAKQIIVQKVREAERAKTVAHYREHIGEILNGTVKKVTRESLIIDLGNNAEGALLRDNLIGREMFRMGDRVRALLERIEDEGRGPQLILSRTNNDMLVELFKIEVPEIQEEVIEIRACARDHGSRAKIAVKTNDGRIDPVGACVGMRGSRVQAVTNELNGERVDIIVWDDNPAQLVLNAMAPAEVASIVMDEETHTMDVAVTEENLAMAIGRSGQNVRLATELTGWLINVISVSEAAAKQKSESSAFIKLFTDKLDIEEDLAMDLVSEGFTSLEELAYVPMEEMTQIDGFDEDLVEELRKRAKDVLLTQELKTEEALEKAEPAQDLLEMEGMDQHLAFVLASKAVITMEDLAELAVDDLIDIEEMTEERAGQLIMTARAPWFAE